MTDAMPTNEPCGNPSLPRPGHGPTIVDRILHASPAVHIALLVAFCALLYLPGMTSLPLLDPEEARCALVADEMLRSGDYVVPHLEGQLYFDKPAPYFWLVAAGTRLTGQIELPGRLIAALAGLAVVICVYRLGRQMFSPAAGLLAALAVASAGEFLFLARYYRMDMPFSAAMWAALTVFYLHDARGRQSHWSASLRFYLLAGLAVLFKGPAGVVLPVALAGLYILITRRWSSLWILLHPVGLVAFAAVAAPWYIAIACRQGGYLQEFFVRQNFQRFAGGGHLKHEWPGILYVPIAFAGMLPWSVYLPGAIWRYLPWQQTDPATRRALTFAWIAAIGVVLVFALSSTKLINYILPVFPALALPIGKLLVDWANCPTRDRTMSAGAVSLAVVVMIFAAVPLGVEIYFHKPLVLGIVVLAVAALAVAGMVRLLAKDRRIDSVLAGAMIFALTFAALAMGPASYIYDIQSTRQLAMEFRKAPSDTLIFVSADEESFLLYSQARRWQVINHRDISKLSAVMRPELRPFCLVGHDVVKTVLANVPEAYLVRDYDSYAWIGCKQASNKR